MPSRIGYPIIALLSAIIILQYAFSISGIWLIIFGLFALGLSIFWIKHNDKKSDLVENKINSQSTSNQRLQILHEQKQLDVELTRQVDAAMQKAIAGLPDGALVMTPALEVRWSNQTASHWLGVQLPHDDGRSIINLLRDHPLATYLQKRNYNARFECSMPNQEQSRMVVQIVPYMDKQWLMQMRDVSESRRLEAMRSDFIANASHELRTPISIIYGYLDMMQSAPSISDEWQQPVEQIFKQSQRLKQIVEDMVQLSSVEGLGTDSRAHTPLDMHGLLTAAVADAQALSGSQQHQISCKADAQWQLMGNSEEIYSVISNFMSNAIRYTPAGGRIVFSWQRLDNGMADFAVQDTGIGIAAEQIPRLSERFYRIDNEQTRGFGGTGLGLAIVKHILQRHQAELIIRSNPKVGSRFIARFPVKRVIEG